jgi:hypothetical protein
MGWTPKRAEGGEGSSAGSALPAPRRRRREVRADADYGSKTPIRPPGGQNNTAAGEIVDTRPRTELVQLGRRWSQIVRDIKAGEYSWAEFTDGLDDEELARGQLKDKNGTFQGRPPSLVPREFHLACQRELRKRFDVLFQQDVIKVAKEYLTLAQSKHLKDETKAKMLQYAMERVFGGIPREMTIKQEAPWEQLIVNVMGDDGDRELPEHLARRYEGYQERQGGGGGDAPRE